MRLNDNHPFVQRQNVTGCAAKRLVCTWWWPVSGRGVKCLSNHISHTVFKLNRLHWIVVVGMSFPNQSLIKRSQSRRNNCEEITLSHIVGCWAVNQMFTCSSEAIWMQERSVVSVFSALMFCCTHWSAFSSDHKSLKWIEHNASDQQSDATWERTGAFISLMEMLRPHLTHIHVFLNAACSAGVECWLRVNVSYHYAFIIQGPFWLWEEEQQH